MFRLLLRVGEAARAGGRARGLMDLVGCLKGILQAQGITVLDDDDEQVEESVRAVHVTTDAGGGARAHRERRQLVGRRRVSFDDARLDETWLSEHSRTTTNAIPQVKATFLLAEPARRGRLVGLEPTRRARSTSTQRTGTRRQAAPKHFQTASPSTGYTSEVDDAANPVLMFQPSQTQLQQNAAAFASTSALRLARRCLRRWHDVALDYRQTRQQAYATATANDRHTLLKQAFDQWRMNAEAQSEERRRDALWAWREQEVYNQYCLHLKGMAFGQWRAVTRKEQANVVVAQRVILQTKYFRRWHRIAVENAAKAQIILTRKYLAVWRDKVARRQLREEQAVAFCEEARLKRCWQKWFWQFCSRRVEGLHDHRVKQHAFDQWRRCITIVRARRIQATKFSSISLARNTFMRLQRALERQRQQATVAQGHHDRNLVSAQLATLRTSARLAPIARTLTLKIRLDLQRKAFGVWHLHLTLTRQAADVDRQRVLQAAWTGWNDALRCRALAQRIDERVLIESLYRWILAERLKSFIRVVDVKQAQRVLVAWHARMLGQQATLENREMAFTASKRRRTLASSMVKIHLAMRIREDGERAAVEFANARALPKILQAWSARARHVGELGKWATDARFYTLSTRTLKTWQEKTTQHQHARRRDAYAAIRTRIKIRLFSTCLQRWRAESARLQDMDREGDRRGQEKLAEVGIQAFNVWRARAAQAVEMNKTATLMNQQNLLSAAVSALAARHTELQSMTAQAEVFRRGSDLVLLSSALKRLQWAQFTANRRLESADALWLRNRDTHVRQMLRHWLTQTLTRRAPPQTPVGEAQEPDSPSLRPASRAALRSSALRPAPGSPPVTTPAYMRTPSRSRRAGRFRPLPTPVPITPFAFSSAYLTTTPAPLPRDVDVQQESDDSRVDVGALTPQVTPFARKLRAGGFGSTPAPAVLRSSVLGRSVQGTTTGTAKSVRFAGAGTRFGGGAGRLKGS